MDLLRLLAWSMLICMCAYESRCFALRNMRQTMAVGVIKAVEKEPTGAKVTILGFEIVARVPDDWGVKRSSNSENCYCICFGSFHCSFLSPRQTSWVSQSLHIICHKPLLIEV